MIVRPMKNVSVTEGLRHQKFDTLSDQLIIIITKHAGRLMIGKDDVALLVNTKNGIW